MLRFQGKMVQILTPLKFVSMIGVEVLHQDIFIFIIQLKDGRSFHNSRLISVIIKLFKTLFPGSRKRRAGGLFYSIFDLPAIFIFGIAFIE